MALARAGHGRGAGGVWAAAHAHSPGKPRKADPVGSKQSAVSSRRYTADCLLPTEQGVRMIQSNQAEPLYRVRMLPKDLGVAIVVLVALLLGLGMRFQVEGRVKQFQDPNSSFRMSYPASWGFVDSLQDVLLKVEDPNTDSAFKTALTIESRELDSASPPTLQTLIDRRVEQRSGLTGYHFLSNGDATVGGAKSALIEYAYVVQ